MGLPFQGDKARSFHHTMRLYAEKPQRPEDRETPNATPLLRLKAKNLSCERVLCGTKRSKNPRKSRTGAG